MHQDHRQAHPSGHSNHLDPSEKRHQNQLKMLKWRTFIDFSLTETLLMFPGCCEEDPWIKHRRSNNNRKHNSLSNYRRTSETILKREEPWKSEVAKKGSANLHETTSAQETLRGSQRPANWNQAPLALPFRLSRRIQCRMSDMCTWTHKRTWASHLRMDRGAEEKKWSWAERWAEETLTRSREDDSAVCPWRQHIPPSSLMELKQQKQTAVIYSLLSNIILAERP